MSYDFYLCDPVTNEPLHTESNHLISGGTHCLGGTNEMWLNITFNYSSNFSRAFEDENGIKILIGLSGAESIPLIKRAISNLGDDVDPDYWKPCDGNAKRALYGLLSFAQMRPDGVWVCHY